MFENCQITSSAIKWLLSSLPSEELFDNLTKDQLLEEADEYKIPLTTKDKQLKRTVSVIVKAALVNFDILSVGEFAAGDNDGADQIAANVFIIVF